MKELAIEQLEKILNEKINQREFIYPYDNGRIIEKQDSYKI
ncbi:hypothetical protein [Lederbergia sp. NSJ-179]|nr:hypothetical protein [Lederbergia sp. NSJ-179]